MLYLGLDGGATKTEGVLLNEDAQVLAYKKLGKSYIVGEPDARACQVLGSIKKELFAEAGIPLSTEHVCGLGLSGIDFDDEFSMQHRILSESLDLSPEKLHLVNDGIVALWGATQEPQAVILQHGSSFTSAYRSSFGNEILFDHLGVCDCYDLRIQALKVTARMIKGVIERSSFCDSMLEYFSVSEDHFAEIHFRKKLSLEKFNHLHKYIYSLWEKGNTTATIIIQSALSEYSMILNSMIRKVKSNTTVAILGGGVILNAPERFWMEIKRRVPHAQLRKPADKPCIGAALMAQHKTGQLTIKS